MTDATIRVIAIYFAWTAITAGVWDQFASMVDGGN